MSNTLTVTVVLPENLLEILEETIAEELATAQRKWKITLSPEELQSVKSNSLEQLRSKVSYLAKNTWDLGSKLTLTVSGESGNLTVSDKPLKSELSFLLSKSGWSATQEEADSVVSANEFYDSIITHLKTWLATAVFYGTGSYANR